MATTTSARSAQRRSQDPADRPSDADYVVPIVHVHVPEPMMELAFCGGLVAAVALGALDLPVGMLLGMGVAIVRHRRT
jgi:hypothetical protein